MKLPQLPALPERECPWVCEELSWPVSIPKGDDPPETLRGCWAYEMLASEFVYAWREFVFELAELFTRCCRQALSIDEQANHE